MAKREGFSAVMGIKQSKSTAALRCYERPASKNGRFSMGASEDFSASSSSLKPLRSTEEAVAAYRTSLQTPSPKDPRHLRLTQSVSDTPNARTTLLKQKPVVKAASIFSYTTGKTQKPALLSTVKLNDNVAFLREPKQPRRKAPSLCPRPIVVKKSGSVTPSGSATPSDFPSFRPITATSQYATAQTTPKSCTPRPMLAPIAKSGMAEIVTQVKSDITPGSATRAALYREHLFQTFQALKFVKTLPPVDAAQLAAKRVVLPKRKGYENKKTIVFDLDETLVHCCEAASGTAVTLPVTFPNGEVVKVTATQAGINIRPYALECLRAANADFEVIVFTASHRCYADVVLDYLDPQHELIHHRLYRENCVSVQGVYIKDLRVLANRSLAHTVIVDNAAFSFAYQLDNGVPIISWRDDKQDVELCNLIDYMKVLAAAEDIRVVNASTFHLSTFYEDYLLENLGVTQHSPKIRKGKWLRRKAW